MYGAAILFPGHPYIESATALSNYGPALSLVAWIIVTCKFQTWGEALWCLCLSTGSRVLSAGLKHLHNKANVLVLVLKSFVKLYKSAYQALSSTRTSKSHIMKPYSWYMCACIIYIHKLYTVNFT